MKQRLLGLIDQASGLLRTDLRYSMSGGFFLTAMQITSAIISFGLTVAFANLLPVDTYGTYRYMLAAYAILSIFALPGIETALMRAVSVGKEGAFAESLRTKFRWGLLGSLAAVFYAGYLFSQDSMVMAGLFIVVALMLPAMESLALYSTFFNGKKLFRQWAAFDIAAQLLSVTALVGAMIATKNIVALLLAYFLPYIIVRVIGSWYVKEYHVTSDTPDSELMPYAKSVTFFQIISKISSSLDQIVLYHVLGPAQVAIYSLAMAIPNRAQGLFKISGILAFPKFAARTSGEVVYTLPRKMLLFGAGIMLVCVVYVLIAPYLFALLFPQYMASLTYSQVAIFFTLSAVTYPFSSFLFSHKRLAENYAISLGSFFSKIIALAVFVPFYGIWGAIISVLVASATTTTISVIVLWRERRSSPVAS